MTIARQSGVCLKLMNFKLLKFIYHQFQFLYFNGFPANGAEQIVWPLLLVQIVKPKFNLGFTGLWVEYKNIQQMLILCEHVFDSYKM